MGTDLDLSAAGRDRARAYLVKHFGVDRVAPLETAGRYSARAAVRDATRVLEYPDATGDRLAKLIPDPEMVRSPSLDSCLQDAQPSRRRGRGRHHEP